MRGLPRLPDDPAHTQLRPQLDQQLRVKVPGDVAVRPGGLKHCLIQLRCLAPVAKVERGAFLAGPAQPPGRRHKAG